MSDIRPKYRKVTETLKPPAEGGRAFCFDCSEKVAARLRWWFSDTQKIIAGRELLVELAVAFRVLCPQ